MGRGGADERHPARGGTRAPRSGVQRGLSGDEATEIVRHAIREYERWWENGDASNELEAVEAVERALAGADLDEIGRKAEPVFYAHLLHLMQISWEFVLRQHPGDPRFEARFAKAKTRLERYRAQQSIDSSSSHPEPAA